MKAPGFEYGRFSIRIVRTAAEGPQARAGPSTDEPGLPDDRTMPHPDKPGILFRRVIR